MPNAKEESLLNVTEPDTVPETIPPDDKEEWTGGLSDLEFKEINEVSDPEVESDNWMYDEIMVKPGPTPSLLETEKIELDLDVDFPKDIHILGTGPVGLHIAHCLTNSSHPPPVTLVMHRPLMMQKWHEEGAAIRVVRGGQVYTSTNFNIESGAAFGYSHDHNPDQQFPGFGENLEHTVEQPITQIHTLIVTTEARKTLRALAAIKHRLKSTTTICIVNGGLGLIEEINEILFPNPRRRPSYMLGNATPGVYSTDYKYTISEQKPIAMSFSIMPRILLPRSVECNRPTIYDATSSWPMRSRYLLRHMTIVPELSARGLDPSTFYIRQLEKLAVNAVIGPLTVLFDCFDKELLHNYPVSHLMKSLLKEICTVICALPELRLASDAAKRFNPDKLEKMIVSICARKGWNRSEMAVRVRAGNPTDIEYYNGYIVKRAHEMGMDCPRLEMITTMVRARQYLNKQEMENLIRFESGANGGNKAWSPDMQDHL